MAEHHAKKHPRYKGSRSTAGVLGGKHVTMAGIMDVPWLSDEEKATMIRSYPEQERAARAYGRPTLGSGQVFPVTEREIAVTPFEIPGHWLTVAGIDFGWEHPTAAVQLAWDRDADVVYLVKCYRRSKATPLEHTATLKTWGGDKLKWAWPRDGLGSEKGTGQQIIELYREAGLPVMPKPASLTVAYSKKGAYSVEAGLQKILIRMQSGRFRVFSNQEDWWSEFRLYHRENGKIVKKNDDLMDATRYAFMELFDAFSVPYWETLSAANTGRQRQRGGNSKLQTINDYNPFTQEFQRAS